MKKETGSKYHWILMILAVILYGISVEAQIMVLKHTDGSEKRFYAGNIREIYFEDNAEVIDGEYTELTAESRIGNFILKFSGEGMPEVSLDIFTNKTAYLPDGTYSVMENSTDIGGINAFFTETTYVDLPEGRQPIAGGHIVVTSTPAASTVEMELRMKNGMILMGRYTGSLHSASQYVDVKMDRGVIDVHGSTLPGEYMVRLSSGDAIVAWIDLFDYPDSQALSEGTYYPSNEGSPVTYSIARSKIEIQFPHQEFALEENVTVSEDGGNYVISCRGTAPDGRIYTLRYEGELEFYDGNEDEEEYSHRGENPAAPDGPTRSEERDAQAPRGMIYDYYLKVITKGGDVTVIPFSDRPSVVFTGDELIISSRGGVQLSYERGEVHDFTILRAEHSGLKEIPAPEPSASGMTICFLNGEILIKGLAPGEAISLYALDGRLLSSARASESGEVCIPKPRGETMICKAGNRSAVKIF